MTKLGLEALHPGMILAKPVITRTGQVIIDAGQMLTNKLIARIDFYNATEIYVKEAQTMTEDESSIILNSNSNASTKALNNPNSSDPRPKYEPTKELVSAITEHAKTASTNIKAPSETISYSQKLRASKKFKDFQMAYTKQIYKAKDALDRVLSGDNIPLDSLVEDTLGLITKDRLTSIELFDMLGNMRQIDDSVYAHSLNVSIIARILAKWLNFTPEEYADITLAGLIHDLGKLQIPKEIINKPGKLTPEEFDVIKTHPQLGYNLIKERNLNPLIKDAVLMHHERCNGGGYPSDLKSSQISKYAKVIMIADVYDAMTAARCYRGPVCPFSVIGNFEKEGLQKYEPQYILTFLEKIASTYQSNRVLLNDGSYATVILLSRNHLSRPIVEFDNGQFLDLNSRHDLSIIKVL